MEDDQDEEPPGYVDPFPGAQSGLQLQPYKKIKTKEKEKIDKEDFNFVPLEARRVLVDELGEIRPDYVDLHDLHNRLETGEVRESCLWDSPYQELELMLGPVAYDSYCECRHCVNCQESLKKMMEQWSSGIEFARSVTSVSVSQVVSKESKVPVSMIDSSCQTIPYGWESENYAVSFYWRDRVLQVFELKDKVNDIIDVFSDDTNRRFRNWYPDAWKEKWSPSRIHWWNPPFSVFGEVVLKILADKSIGVVVTPAWRNENWWKVLDSCAARSHVVPAGERVFELDGNLVGQTKWDVVFFLLQPEKGESARRRERRLRAEGK